MICFNCGSVLSNSDYCSKCGADVSIYKKIINMSNVYYNMGLTKAANRDLMGAADALNRSLRLNKRNIDARNLLGLVYFELGEIVQAFSEWVISQNMQPDSNVANRYIQIIREDRNRLDALNQTIKKFNVALEYAKDGTDDMAIIQLKKVLNQNPNMVKAYQLLALLYIKSGEYERADRAIKKALKIDTCNTISLKYKNEIKTIIDIEKKINPEGRAKRKKKLREVLIERPYLSGDDVIIPQSNFKEASSSVSNIIHTIFGILIGAAVIYFIVTPLRVSNQTQEVNDVVLEYSQKLAIKNSSISELERQVEALQEELAGYTEDTSNSIVDNYNYLIAAVKAYLDEDYATGSEQINKVDSELDMSSEEFDTVYNDLYEKMHDYLSETYYNAGMDAYNQGNLSECIENLEKCIEVDDTNVEAIYKLAWAYSENGDSDKSQQMFQKIVDDFPDSDYYSVALGQIVN